MNYAFTHSIQNETVTARNIQRKELHTIIEEQIFNIDYNTNSTLNYTIHNRHTIVLIINDNIIKICTIPIIVEYSHAGRRYGSKID